MAHLSKDDLTGLRAGARRFRAVAMGASAGGVEALGTVLPSLDAGLPLGIIIVLHRGAGSQEADAAFVAFLQRTCALPVAEVEDQDEILPGRVYLAPADYHLEVDRGRFLLSVDPKVNHSRPSIDLLLQSVARAYGPAAIGVVLTGANHDGAAGLADIRRCGGVAVVQDPARAKHPAMPQAALAAANPHYVLDLPDIPQLLNALAAGGPGDC